MTESVYLDLGNEVEELVLVAPKSNRLKLFDRHQQLKDNVNQTDTIIK